MIPIIFTLVTDEKDQSKFEQIWNRYNKDMLKVAHKILKDHHAGYDAVQESCLKIIRNLDKIESISSNETKAYIVYIVKNTSLDMLRRAKAKMEKENNVAPENIPSDGLNIPDNLIAKEGYETIMAIIKTLPEQLKEVVYYSLVHEHSHKEIADLLNITEEASRARLFRARKEIIKRLEGGSHDK